MEEIWSWPAAKIASAIRDGHMSAREVAETTLAHTHKVQSKINALSEVTEEIALTAAEAVDKARAAGEPLGPLAGVPVTTKNNVDQAGTRNTGGIAFAKDLIAEEDSPVVALLKASGAVIVGRSNVPAFSFRWFTDTDLHGRTLNPHGADLSPGGSSGGAGAALAAGIGALAHGNDIGGSIRQPAHVNGVVGLRPTMGRVPSYVPSAQGLRALTSQLIATDGPMARTVEDVHLGLTAMSGADAMDPQAPPAPPAKLGTVPPRVGLVRSSGLGQPEPEVDAALTIAADALSAQGAVVEDITLPHFEEAHHIWQRLVFHAIEHHYLDAIRASGDTALIHNINLVIEMAEPLSGGGALDLWARRLQIMRDWSSMFQTHPVVIMPISYRHALKADADQGTAAELDQLFHDQSPLLATALMGNPGLAVPTGRAADTAPTGVQLISKWWDEGTLLAAGMAVEAACPPITPVQI